MVDNVAITAGSGVTIATDDIGGIQFQRVKLAQGADGVGVDVSAAAPLQVNLANTGANATSINTAETGGALTSLQLIDDTVVASGTALGTTKSSLAGASVTTAAPTYTTGQVNPLSMDTTGSLRTAETGLALTSLQLIDDTIVASGTPIGSTKGSLASGSVTTASPTYTTGQVNPLSLDTTGALRVNVTAGGAGGGAVTNAGTFAVQESGGALTSLALIDDTIAATGAALGSTKSSLAGASVTTSAPTYTTGQINPLSMDTSGNLRVTGGGGGTQYVEDVAAATDPSGNMLMAVRKDTLSTSEVSADGDNIALKATNKGKLHVAAEVRLGDTLADVGSGTGGTATQRVIIDNSQLTGLIGGAVPVVNGGLTEIVVNPSSTTALEHTTGSGAIGDMLDHLVCVVTNPAACAVYVRDGFSSFSSSYLVLPSPLAAGVSVQHIVLGGQSEIGAWYVGTDSGVNVRAYGTFT